MFRVRLPIFVIFFAAVIPSLAALDDFDHVALLECDQKNRRFELLVLGKGNANTITKNIAGVQNIYLFNGQTAKFPSKYRLCLVRLAFDKKEDYRRKITWIDPKKPLEPQLRNLGLDKRVVERLLCASDQFMSNH
jgi:hypothetical protein